jgi:hypothetical protein
MRCTMGAVERWLVTIFCVTVMAAGWYYMFYSRAAHRLQGIEPTGANRQRVRLRQTNGFMMVMLGAFLYVALYGMSWERPGTAFGVVWLLIFGFLGAMIILGLADIRLTWKLSQERRRGGFTVVRKSDDEEQR